MPRIRPWRDLALFYEYFDGDSGRGCGAAHQTGWSALVANLLVESDCGGAGRGSEKSGGSRTGSVPGEDRTDPMPPKHDPFPASR